ncbi:response regulator [Chitinophaga sp. SYP-B3965]|uniref:response regulator transcription factor n=1 Tax=Chitinophaga sp. SYP-B3965 TaxID=2663120 RepID=UPI001299CF09|nr:response regulator transcription factor [Chitinophaga sp. SYP-B3965]MRG48734.1 response regulator [Chitinophaga sp. SYP-B3965]
MHISIGIVDDHSILLKSLVDLINGFEHCKVTRMALNGKELLIQLKEDPSSLPDIMLVDVIMPGLNGVETVKELSLLYPAIKLIAFSTKEDDDTVISMIRNGCCAYLVKGIDAEELEKAILEVHEKGHYNGDAYNLNYRRIMARIKEKERVKLSPNEAIFLQLACSDLTYKDIASKMHLAERTIDGYRESLFGKLNVQSRVGMVLEAIRLELVNIKDLK